MLSLLHTYSPPPSSRLHHLVLPLETLLLYPSADAVVILNARNTALVRVLAFWEAFPGSIHATGTVSCISVDSGMKLIVAAMNSHIATWSLSGVQNDTWRIHSSLSLPQEQSVMTLDSKSGLLAVGTIRGLSVYTLILENDLPTWSQKWMVPLKASPSLVRFAPSLMYIATTTKIDNAVRLYSTTSGRQTQSITHSRPVIDISWRHSQASSRDDLILYTITSDSTLRIFFPALDSPQYLQLHASVDLFSSLPYSVTSPQSYQNLTSSVFWLDREVIGQSLDQFFKDYHDQDNANSRRLKDIRDERWDVFLRVIGDGSVVLTAVANIDRRPPTLLKHFMLQQFLPSTLPSSPSYLYLLPTPSETSSLSLITLSPLTLYEISLADFFDAQPGGIKLKIQHSENGTTEKSSISCFVRTPEGKGVGVIRNGGGGGESWTLQQDWPHLSRSGSWEAANQVVVLDNGRNFATYSKTGSSLTLHTYPPVSIVLPQINSLFTMPSNEGHDSILGITEDLSIAHVHLTTDVQESPGDNTVALTLHSHNHLPLSSPPSMILPVDPMAWGSSHPWVEHDALLSISEEGELAFWIPDDLQGPPSFGQSQKRENESGWRCTGRVRTGRTGITKARCSSAKKTALVTPSTEGDELTIWDSKESEFASGLEYHQTFSDSINDLDWSSTPDMQSILAVGFLHHVELLCQQRMTYFDEGPGWALCWKIDIGNFIPYSISDSIWLANCSLLIGAGHQMLLYGPPTPSDKESVTSEESLFEYVARQNGPLENYHPQMLLQCLLWDKVELVKDVIINLAKDLENQRPMALWTSVPVEQFLQNNTLTQGSLHKKRYTALFDGPEEKDSEEGFCRPLVTKLLEKLESDPLPHLTPNEQAHLLVLIQTTLEIDEQRRSLDANGLRYLITMRSFYILNHRASAPTSPESRGAVARKPSRRERLRYRDMIWAFHSESHDLLLNASSAACNGKMCWFDARALGVAIWLTSVESMKSQLEIIARNEYMAGDARDPTACSLFYFALGKIKLVHGLWRQAAWHKEQAVMLRFLSNDFSQPRWRTAALKNAFALLGKQRFEYAAAFFLLGNSLKDAVNVCIKQLGDFQLAVAIARVVEQSNEGPVLLSILNDTVLPIAFRDGNRWLASWAFWLLHRRDLSVRVLVTPLQDLVRVLDISVTDIGEPHYDDPSLALLFSQLRSKTLQAAKGNSEISGRLEFNFVLQIARVFCRMGCHVLALDLVRSWSFDRPAPIETNGIHPTREPDTPSSPTVTRRSMFSMPHAIRRRSSIVIDMDISSFPSTRAASPEGNTSMPPAILEEPPQDDLVARKAGLGNLMKSARQDVKVPEFDMNAFNF